MIKSIATSEHYFWGDNCEGWHLVKTPGLSIIQERMPANTSEKPHYHELAQQFFFILAGTATFKINGDTFLVSAQQGLHILPEQVHQILNLTNADLLFTVTLQPTSRGNRIEIN